MSELEKRKAWFTFDGEEGNLWYFGLPTHAPGKLRQREVRAIIDVDSDGCLAGVELIYDMPPLFPPQPIKGITQDEQ